MTRSRQEQALCALVETLFTAEMSSEEQWPEIFEALRKVLNFSSAVFIPIDPVNWTLQPGYTYDCPNLTAEYLAHYQRLDPYVTAAACLKSSNTPIRFSDIADIAGVSQGEFGSLLRQVPYFHALVSAPLLQGCRFGVISVHRRREQPDFNSQEVRLFGWFALQLVRAIDYARLRSRFDPLPFQGDFNKVINFQGVTPPTEIVVSSTGGLIDVTEAAQRVLAMLPEDRSFGLPSPLGPADIWYTPCQVYKVQSPACPPESLLSLTRLSALPSLMPRYRPPVSLQIPRLGQPFITLIEPMPQAPTLPARLENLKLSPREHEVITLRLQGLLIKQIAGCCNLQETTTKEYLRNVYKKAGVRTGREFMALMLGNE